MSHLDVERTDTGLLRHLDLGHGIDPNTVEDVSRGALDSLHEAEHESMGNILGDDLLTEEEHEAIALSGKLADKCRKIIGSGPTAEHDWAEMAHRIHDIQYAIMHNAAARAYPDRYRRLGGTLRANSEEARSD